MNVKKYNFVSINAQWKDILKNNNLFVIENKSFYNFITISGIYYSF